MPTQSNNPHLPFGDQRTAPWYGKDIISVKQFNREDLEYIFAVAHEMRTMVERVGTFDLLKGKILANLFYEPSTRTSSSFTAAMERLGGSVIPINEVSYSSVSKGEIAAGYRPHAGVLRGRDRAAASGDGISRHRGEVPHASRSSMPATASASTPRRRCWTFHHPRGAGPPGRSDGDDAGRPEIRAHRALALAPALPLQREAELCLAGDPADACRGRRGAQGQERRSRANPRRSNQALPADGRAVRDARAEGALRGPGDVREGQGRVRDRRGDDESAPRSA